MVGNAHPLSFSFIYFRMSGRNHHTLPRFWQKEFASQIKGKGKKEKVFTCLYLKNQDVKEDISTKDIGSTRDFYGKDSSINADPEITKLENSFLSAIIRRIRSSPEGEIVNHEIPEFVVHLYARSEYIRDSKVEVYEQIRRGFHNSVDTKKFAGLNDDMSLREKIIFSTRIKHYFDQRLELFMKSVPEDHINSLSIDLIPKALLEKQKALKWFVVHSKIPLILGDVRFLLKEESGNFIPWYDRSSPAMDVFVPISKNVILIGTISNQMQNINFWDFRREYSKWCRKYFICSENTQEIRLLSSNIGRKLKPFIRKYSKQMLVQYFKG